MFDLSDLDSVPTKDGVRLYLCTECRCMSPDRSSCASCSSTETQIPSLDRRPLLLNRVVRNSILDLIDNGANLILSDLLSDDQDHLVSQYLPFLSRVLEESETAEKLEAMGKHDCYRRTEESHDSIVALLENMTLPATMVAS